MGGGGGGVNRGLRIPVVVVVARFLVVPAAGFRVAAGRAAGRAAGFRAAPPARRGAGAARPRGAVAVLRDVAVVLILLVVVLLDGRLGGGIRGMTCAFPAS